MWVAFSLGVIQGLDVCKLAVEPVTPEEAIILRRAGVCATRSSSHHTDCAVHPSTPRGSKPAHKTAKTILRLGGSMLNL